MTNMLGYNARREIRTEARIELVKQLLKGKKYGMYYRDIVEHFADKFSERITALTLQHMRRKGIIRWESEKSNRGRYMLV